MDPRLVSLFDQLRNLRSSAKFEIDMPNLWYEVMAFSSNMRSFYPNISHTNVNGRI